MEKKDVITSVTILRKDLYKCLNDLVNARLHRDRIREGEALFNLESLMVSTIQEFDFIIDYLKEGEEWEKKEQ